jgi:hypothetical protein
VIQKQLKESLQPLLQLKFHDRMTMRIATTAANPPHCPATAMLMPRKQALQQANSVPPTPSALRGPSQGVHSICTLLQISSIVDYFVDQVQVMQQLFSFYFFLAVVRNVFL